MPHRGENTTNSDNNQNGNLPEKCCLSVEHKRSGVENFLRDQEELAIIPFHTTEKELRPTHFVS